MSRLFQLVLLLILLNVVVFLWPNSADFAPHVHIERKELNPHFVRLNKEIEERFYSKASSDVVIAAPDSQPLPENLELLSVVDSNSIVAEVAEGDVCYRLGPFTHQASYELAQAVLFNADVNFQKSTRVSQESDVFRLYVGPFANTEEVAQARVELTRKRILDHFARKLNDDQYMISLGIYSTQETADTALRLFKGKLNDIKVRNETVVLPDSYWLHFALRSESSKLAQLSQIDWGESSVKFGPHECKT